MVVKNGDLPWYKVENNLEQTKVVKLITLAVTNRIHDDIWECYIYPLYISNRSILGSVKTKIVPCIRNGVWKIRGGKKPFGDDEFSSPKLFLVLVFNTKNDENTFENERRKEPKNHRIEKENQQKIIFQTSIFWVSFWFSRV